MTDVNLTAKDPARCSGDALVVAVARSEDGPRLLGRALPDAVATALAPSLGRLGVSGKADEVVRLPSPDGLGCPVLVLTGVGPCDGAPGSEQLRRAAGAAVRALAGTDRVVLALPAEDAAAVGAVAEGALLGAYRFGRYRSSDPAPVARVELVTARAKGKDARAALDRARAVAAAVHGARDLVNTSPRDLYPESFADAARAAAKGTRVKVTVLDDRALLDGGYGGIVGVGQGSARPPRLVKVVWAPARARAHYALVGKGITFDTGGISIKPAKGMEAMKSDMAGAAAVLHTVLAAAALDLPVRVTGWLPLAENMPGGGAQRPSDVVTMRDGTTVEVLNTDAEGRMVLGDALVAAREEDPDVVLDIATLTGAQMVALGTRVAAVMGTEETRAAVVAAAGTAGEEVWPMPLPAELAESLRSKVADLANIGDRFGGMLVAGLFLKEFTGTTPWAHIDIAGPAYNEAGAYGYTPKGGTGMGVRSMLAVLEAAAAR